MKRTINIVTLILVSCLGLFGNDTWIIKHFEDEMSGEITSGLFTKETFPTKEQNFPYDNIISVFNCHLKGDIYSLSFRFSKDLVLSGSDYKNRMCSVITRIKYEDELTSVELRQSLDTENILYINPDLLNRLFECNHLKLEVPIHGHGNVYFEYDISNFEDMYLQLSDEFHEAQDI